MTRRAMPIGMENSIEMIQMNAIIIFEMYLGGRALQRNESKWCVNWQRHGRLSRFIRVRRETTACESCLVMRCDGVLFTNHVRHSTYNILSVSFVWQINVSGLVMSIYFIFSSVFRQKSERLFRLVAYVWHAVILALCRRRILLSLLFI